MAVQPFCTSSFVLETKKYLLFMLNKNLKRTVFWQFMLRYLKTTKSWSLIDRKPLPILNAAKYCKFWNQIKIEMGKGEGNKVELSNDQQINFSLKMKNWNEIIKLPSDEMKEKWNKNFSLFTHSLRSIIILHQKSFFHWCSRLVH